METVPGFVVGGGAVAAVSIGGNAPLALIAGPCVIEDEALTNRVAERLVAICAARGLPLIFKTSFDKANRTSGSSFRGPGLHEGLAILDRLRRRLGVPVVTDLHAPDQAPLLAEVVDLLQIPAFLCRQTDLLRAAAATGKPVNLKKGQFLSPAEAGPAVEKLRQGGASGVVVTERGTTFGYHDLVVDMRSLPLIRAQGVPVCFDATHSVQQPGGQGSHSGGRRALVAPLARAAVGAGVDALFLETHEDPDRALSDGPNMISLDALPALLDVVLAIDRAVRAGG
jgi:2-dehydro-3-deoxyphosphooctonate aldolase (KDO 8-P synthase)